MIDIFTFNDLKDGEKKDSQIQYQKDVTGGGETLRVTTSNGSGDKIAQALAEKFPGAKFKAIGKQQVGAIIGREILQSAIIACLLSLFGILVYVAIRYEFSFAVGAVVAVIHDVLMTIGWYCMANGVSGRQFNATVVAAVLTIIGFSINDTIVVLDRVRENVKLNPKQKLGDVINMSVNQTLSRTILTSLTVFLTVLALWKFGGAVIHDFAFSLLVGVVFGTYSSVFISCPIVLLFENLQISKGKK